MDKYIDNENIRVQILSCILRFLNPFFHSFSHIQFIINVWIYLLHFLYFRELNFIFSSFRDAIVSEVGRRKVKKILFPPLPVVNFRPSSLIK